MSLQGVAICRSVCEKQPAGPEVRRTSVSPPQIKHANVRAHLTVATREATNQTLSHTLNKHAGVEGH